MQRNALLERLASGGFLHSSDRLDGKREWPRELELSRSMEGSMRNPCCAASFDDLGSELRLGFRGANGKLETVS